MTYREKYFALQKIQNRYLNNSAIKELLMFDGNFNDFTALIKNFDNELNSEKDIDEKVERIIAGEPLQYVIGYAYFVNGRYKVTPSVFIPRQETEELAVSIMTRIVKMFGKDPKITIVDIGTGSGILAIYLKEYFPNARVIGIDISEEALEIARENASIHHVDIEFLQGNMLDPFKDKIDVIVSNPPYIGNKETVDEQTLKYEPHLALFATPKTKYYEEILTHLDQMNDQYLIGFEIGEDMEDELTELLEKEYKGIGYSFKDDIYMKPRYLYIVKNKELDRYKFDA